MDSCIALSILFWQKILYQKKPRSLNFEQNAAGDAYTLKNYGSTFKSLWRSRSKQGWLFKVCLQKTDDHASGYNQSSRLD